MVRLACSASAAILLLRFLSWIRSTRHCPNLEEITRVLLLASTAPFSIQLCGEVHPKGGLSHNNAMNSINDSQGLVPSPGKALCLESDLKHLSI